VQGWLADFFRLHWALVYWNIRKTWFRLRRGRGANPCQSPSDSGRALQTGCEACLSWHKPSRFHRVCPLLVHAPGGLRCSANAADVRPFWGRAVGVWAKTFLTIYLAGAFTAFAFLRTIGYPVSIVHVTWPGLWYRVPQARGGYFVAKSNRAFNAGNTREGLIALENAYEFDPSNLSTGLALVKHYQAIQPQLADKFFQRLLNDHPTQRDAIAQEWFRALLARADYPRIAQLAAEEVVNDVPHANAWMRALIFSSRQARDDRAVRAVFANRAPAAQAWRTLLVAELLIRTGKSSGVTLLRQQWPETAPPYSFYYQSAELSAYGDQSAALATLERNAPHLDAEAVLTLRLDIAAAAGPALSSQRQADVTRLLGADFGLPAIKILCAHLIRHPSAEIFAQLYARIEQAKLAIDTDSAGDWFSLFCTAGAVGDSASQHAIGLKLKALNNGRFLLINAVEEYFGEKPPKRKITGILPALPLPLEVVYALLERYPVPPPTPPASTSAPARKP